MASRLNRFDLYERCVQAPGAMARFLEAVHGRQPRVLREDFSGGGALCKAWLRRDAGRQAVAVDLDPQPLRRLKGVEGVRAVLGDALKHGSTADVIAALNFPIGYFHTRAELLRYLRLSCRRLRPGGVFVADMYGGRSAFEACTKSVDVKAADGTRIEYEWEQRTADAVTARVFNAIHFSVHDRTPPRRLREAFTYDWRLWSIPELRDAYAEAGFSACEIYDQNAGAIDHLGNLHVRPVNDGGELDDDWVVYVVGRKQDKKATGPRSPRGP